MKLAPVISAIVFLFSVQVLANKPDLQCYEDLSADAQNVLEVFYKVNPYGYKYQVIHVHHGLEIPGYGRLMAGQVYDNFKSNFNYLDNGNCTEGVSLGVSKQGNVHQLIFTCSIDSGPSDWVTVATLVCL